MKKLIRVKSVEYIDGYKLRLAFTNGKIKVVDLSYIFKSNAGHYFEPLRDLERFRQVYCDYGTICWPNEADLCPDLLYTIGKDVARPMKKRKKFLRASKFAKKQEYKYLIPFLKNKVINYTVYFTIAPMPGARG